MPAGGPRFSCANLALLPPSSFHFIVTGADRGFLPPSLDSRVQIKPFRPRHPFISLPRVQIVGFAPVGFHGCCPEQRQGLALLRVLRKRNSSGKASSDAGPELAGRESCVAMESPQALMCPLEKGINKSSSDDRPGPGICDSKYVEDAKAARSVRVWDRVTMKNTRLGGLR